MRALLFVAVLGVALCLPEYAGAKNADHCAPAVDTTLSTAPFPPGHLRLHCR
jgi:hypothetical protein